MTAQPIREVFSFELSCRKLQNSLFLFFHRRINFHTIENQERFHSKMPDSLVAIHKSVIHYE